MIPLEKVQSLKNIIIAPMNTSDQTTINERGEIIGKKCLTHNQSFGGISSNTSVNSCLIESELQDVMYSRCLKRILHHIIALRQKYPQKRILIQKIDWKAAYRRAHLFKRKISSSDI